MALPVEWSSDPTPVPSVANHVAVQTLDEHTLLVTMGYVSPPLVLGELEAQLKQVQELGPLPIRPIATFAIPANVAEALFQILDQVLHREGPIVVRTDERSA